MDMIGKQTCRQFNVGPGPGARVGSQGFVTQIRHHIESRNSSVESHQFFFGAICNQLQVFIVGLNRVKMNHDSSCPVAAARARRGRIQSRWPSPGPRAEPEAV
jgi:hypothetical protein